MKPEKRLERAKRLGCKHNIPEGNPDLLYLLWDKIRSANFRLAVLIGTNGLLVALLLTLMLRG